MTTNTVMLSLRTFLLRSRSGHMVRFTANEPINVPTAVIREAQEAGCVIVEGAPKGLFEDNRTIKQSLGGPLRDSVLYIACQRVRERNDTTEFTAGGIPRVPAIEKITGFNVNAKEVGDMYQRVVGDEKNNNDVSLHPSAEKVIRVLDAEDKAELLTIAMDFVDDEEFKRLEGLTLREVRRDVMRRLAEAN